jgi:hypothetical protein
LSFYENTKNFSLFPNITQKNSLLSQNDSKKRSKKAEKPEPGSTPEIKNKADKNLKIVQPHK